MPQWHAWRLEPSAQAVMPLANTTEAELLQRLARTRSSFADQTVGEYRWMIELDRRLVGTVALRDVSWTHRVGELAYMLTESARRRGIGTLAVGEVVDRAFGEAALHRIWLRTTKENVPSRKLAERLGFQFEGTLRAHVVIQGRRVDEVLYGLLRPEWQARRAAGQ